MTHSAKADPEKGRAVAPFWRRRLSGWFAVRLPHWISALLLHENHSPADGRIRNSTHGLR